MASDDQNFSLTFGSAFRRGREDLQYQQGRLRMLCDFQIRLTEALSRQLRNQQRRGREVWEAKCWLENKSKKLEHDLKTSEKVVGELRDWATELKNGKEYLEKTTRELADSNTRLEKTIREQVDWAKQLEKNLREQADWIAKLEEAKSYLEKTVREQADFNKQLEKNIREQADWIAKLEEAKSYLEKTVHEQVDWSKQLEKTTREQADWIAKLTEAKEYLAGQLASSQAQLEADRKKLAELNEYLERLRSKWWWRLGRRIKFIYPSKQPATD